MADIQQVHCPHCLTLNRVPAQRLPDRPKCGKCKQTLFSGQPVELDEAGFRKLLNQEDLPLVVDFWAAWCGPCQMMAPHFQAAAGNLDPYFRLAKVNTEVAPNLSAQYGIRSIPTLVAFHRGREIGRVSGALSQSQLLQWVRSLPLGSR